jgi:phosphatidate phosphatase LPIN
MLVYGEQLPRERIEELSAKTGFMSRFRTKTPNEITKIHIKQIPEEEIKKTIELKQQIKKKESMIAKYKSFIPTSNQMTLLELKEGRNEINFVCRSRLSGTQQLKAEVYLWKSDSKIIISDVDGTITKSDVLGQVLPMIGKDWSHAGVTDLFTNIEKNGYKMIYLTARAVCQAESTKNYLHTLFQRNIIIFKFIYRSKGIASWTTFNES